MPGQPEPGSNPFITFAVTACTVQEPGLPASTVIEATTNWQVQANFSFGGMFAPWLVSLPVQWQFTVRAESMGPGPEVVLGTVQGTTNPGQLQYGPGNPAPVPTINVAAGTLPPGPYKLVNTLTFIGNPPPPMAGYSEEPIIQII